MFALISFAARATFSEKLLDSRYASWGVSPSYTSSIHLKDAWKKYKKNKDVIVAVIDTGIDPVHPFLKGNLLDSKSYGIDFSKNSKYPMSPSDTHGHGTHVSGIIRSVLPNVKILTLKYFDPSASGEDNLNATIKALEYAVDQNVDIINYSGGGPEASAKELEVLQAAERKGILVVAASGNNGSNIDNIAKAYFPASYGLSNIITVTAHDKMLNVLNSSNYGIKTVDIAAPGHRIKSALPHGRAGYLTGTSQATAFVSGVAALLKSQYPSLDAKKLKNILKSSAKQESTLLTKVNSKGRLDATRALDYASTIFTKRAVASSKKKEKVKKLASNKVGTIIYRKISSKKETIKNNKRK
jgi:subtilisin family serine protease